MLTALHFIAEKRIEKAIQEGAMDDLSHWKNKPMPEDDMKHVPADLRMGYKILKNSGHVPEEVQLRNDIQQTEDLLKNCTDEKEKYKKLKKLEFLRYKLEFKMGKKLQLDTCSKYYEKVVERVPVNKV